MLPTTMVKSGSIVSTRPKDTMAMIATVTCSITARLVSCL